MLNCLMTLKESKRNSMDKFLRFTLKKLETRPTMMRSLLTALSTTTDILHLRFRRKISWLTSRPMPRSCSTPSKRKEFLKKTSRLSKESQSNSPNSFVIITSSASFIKMTMESISQFQQWLLLSGLKSALMLLFSTTLGLLLNKSKYNYKLYY